MKNFKKGFTLIELLVVVAIIGILASIVLASLNTARDKGLDAAIKSNLSNMRAQAALYYDDNKTYNSTGEAVGCTASVDGIMGAGCVDLFAVTQMAEAMKAAAHSSGSAVNSSIDASGEHWAASALLKNQDELSFCVDGGGVANVLSTAVAGVCSPITP